MFAGTLAPYSFKGITGKDHDPKSGLMFYNSRWYDPQTGRFTQPDTFKGALHRPMTQHPYAYVGSNPINNLDPTGHYYDPGGNYREISDDGYKDLAGEMGIEIKDTSPWKDMVDFALDDLYNNSRSDAGAGAGGSSSGGGESRPPTPEERDQIYSLASQPVPTKHNVQTGTLKQVVSYIKSMPGKPGTGRRGRLPGVLLADNSLSSVRNALVKAKNDAWLGMQIFANEAPGAIKNFWEEAENAPVIGPVINFISPNELDAHISATGGKQLFVFGYFGQRILGKSNTLKGLELLLGKEVAEGAGKATRETLLEAASNQKLNSTIQRVLSLPHRIWVKELRNFARNLSSH